MLNDSSQKMKRRSLRKRMTTAEKTLWLKLRSRRLANYRFHRQTSIGKYIVDFYCPAKKLILEIDRDVHGFFAQKRHDQERQSELEAPGFRILRASGPTGRGGGRHLRRCDGICFVAAPRRCTAASTASRRLASAARRSRQNGKLFLCRPLVVSTQHAPDLA